jgi:SRSO17 transposase
LNDPFDILAIDETGFLKQGDQSVGVQVQYYGVIVKSGRGGKKSSCLGRAVQFFKRKI